MPQLPCLQCAKETNVRRARFFTELRACSTPMQRAALLEEWELIEEQEGWASPKPPDACIPCMAEARRIVFTFVEAIRRRLGPVDAERFLDAWGAACQSQGWVDLIPDPSLFLLTIPGCAL